MLCQLTLLLAGSNIITKEKELLAMRFDLSETEKSILELSWSRKCWMAGAEFWSQLNEQGRSFKRQTVNTYLSRMSDKGLLIKNKTKYIYAFTKEEFEEKRAAEVLNTMYNGSLKNFLTALTGNIKISPDEASELRNYLDKLK